MNSYNSILLVVLVLIPYFITVFAVKITRMKLATHRKLWNMVLLVSFLISGFIGLILAIFIDQKLSIEWYRELLWVHVEFGVIMAVVSIFHIAWHLNYYLCIFRRAGKGNMIDKNCEKKYE